MDPVEPRDGVWIEQTIRVLIDDRLGTVVTETIVPIITVENSVDVEEKNSHVG
jgi:hypothetical protein